MSDEDNILSTINEDKDIQHSPPVETENNNEPKLLPKLMIRTPSYIAHLNASLLATELDEKVQLGSYHSPSLMANDEHSDLDPTSPKLKFKNVIEYHSPISISSKTHSDSPISNRESPTREQNILEVSENTEVKYPLLGSRTGKY